jgi:hypothetical protein
MDPVNASSSPLVHRGIRGLFQRLHRVFKSPADLLLAARIALFLRRVPRDLAPLHLGHFLAGLRNGNPGVGRTPSTDRIIRIRQFLLRRRWFAAANTCYMRALVLYRFLDPGKAHIRIHFVVEPPQHAQDRWRGHAWVTLDGQVIETPDPPPAGECREIYVYPEH